MLSEHWDSPQFEVLLTQELATRALKALAIERDTTHGGRVETEDISVSVLAVTEVEHTRELKIGVFFSEAVGGCNCADDPFRVNGYCERCVRVDRPTGMTCVFEAPV